MVFLTEIIPKRSCISFSVAAATAPRIWRFTTPISLFSFWRLQVWNGSFGLSLRDNLFPGLWRGSLCSLVCRPALYLQSCNLASPILSSLSDLYFVVFFWLGLTCLPSPKISYDHTDPSRNFNHVYQASPFCPVRKQFHRVWGLGCKFSWADLQYWHEDPFVEWALNPIRKISISYPQNTHTTIAPIGIFCQVAHYPSLQHLQLGKSVDDVSPSSFGRPSGTMETIWKGGGFPVSCQY